MAKIVRVSDSNSRSTLASAASAVLGLLAAMSCCLPTGVLLASAGLAGASAFFETAAPYLIGLSILSLGFGLWYAARARSCSLARRRLYLGVIGVRVLVVVT